MNIWVAVSSKKFLSYIIDILKSQNDGEIQTKLLQMIQNWGTDFENKKKEIPNFYKVYNKFKVNGVVFPPREEPNYYKYILRNEGAKYNYNNDNYEDKKNDYEEEVNAQESNHDNEFSYIESIKNKLKASNFEHKYRRLVAFLLKMHDNIELANIFINKRKISELKEPIDTIKKGNKTIMDTITSGRLKDEKLMEITLGTTEDINQTLSREEELKKGNRPNNFTSYFVLNEIIPIKNKNMKSRAKSEKKKGILNPKNNLNRNDENNKNNNTNINDIFDLFSSSKPKDINENSNYNSNLYNNNQNNQDNNMISNYYTNQNINDKFFGDNNNYDNNNRINNNIYSSKNLRQANYINNNQMNTFDLLGESLNINNQETMNNNNNRNNKLNIDMYGPEPQINSNQLVNYIGEFNNNNDNNINNNNYNNYNFNNNGNNQYPSFGGNYINNNMLSQNNQGSNYMKEQNYGNSNGQQMTQEEIEREQRLKELDDLF